MLLGLNPNLSLLNIILLAPDRIILYCSLSNITVHVYSLSRTLLLSGQYVTLFVTKPHFVSQITPDWQNFKLLLVKVSCKHRNYELYFILDYIKQLCQILNVLWILTIIWCSRSIVSRSFHSCNRTLYLIFWSSAHAFSRTPTFL